MLTRHHLLYAVSLLYISAFHIYQHNLSIKSTTFCSCYHLTSEFYVTYDHLEIPFFLQRKVPACTLRSQYLAKSTTYQRVPHVTIFFQVQSQYPWRSSFMPNTSSSSHYLVTRFLCQQSHLYLYLITLVWCLNLVQTHPRAFASHYFCTFLCNYLITDRAVVTREMFDLTGSYTSFTI